MQLDGRTRRINQSPDGFDLLAASSYVGCSGQEEQIRGLLSAPVSWDSFTDLVRRHRTASLVVDRLERFGGGLVPAPAMEALKRVAFESWRRSMVLTHELCTLLDRFSAAGIELMPLKGNLLSSRLFGDPGMRQVGDIDVLVRETDLEAGHRLLLAAGYRRAVPGRELTPKQSAVYRRQAHHWTYRNDEADVSVELHWRVFRWSFSETGTLWSRSRPFEWMGRKTVQPDDALLLLILCDHGSQHRHSHLKWLADIVSLLCSTELNWPEVLRLARGLDLELSLAQAALLIDRLFPVSLPGPLAAFAMRERGAERLAQASLEGLFDRDARLLRPNKRWSGVRNLPYWFCRGVGMAGYWSRLRKRRSWRERLQAFAVARSDFEAFPLPDRLFWMYYVFRPVFWAIRFVRGR